MSKPDDAPEWAMDEASGVERDIPSRVGSANRPFIRSVIARALIAAERRGIEAEREQCAKVADLFATDAGDRAARGYATGEERARRQAGKEIAVAIRQLGASE